MKTKVFYVQLHGYAPFEVICHLYAKFEVPVLTYYNNTEDNAKCMVGW